ncbi:MAG TPA: hemerythrin domain-containing protein [Thermoanaerobaculia bacterium]|nr:hemerythrin domain-containing protein [Thermoanaerobaculia bacterium]
MNLLFALLGEHGPLHRQLEVLRLTAPRYSDSELRAATFALAEAIESHAALEDELLFAPLAASGAMPPGPVEAMRAEHRQIETLLGQLLAPAGEPGRPDPQRTALRLVETVRHHFAHEENVLFPLAAGTLEPARLEALGALWAERRGVDLDRFDSATAPARLAAEPRAETSRLTPGDRA